MNFHFFFVFRSKNVICVGPKMLCSQLNRITKFCDIGTGDFRFRFRFLAVKGISVSSPFSFTAENERCIFGRRLHQTVSDYTLRQWFFKHSTIPFPDSLYIGAVPRKISFTLHFSHKSSFIIVTIIIIIIVSPLSRLAGNFSAGLVQIAA